MSKIKIETTITNLNTKEIVKKNYDAIMTNNSIKYKDDGVIIVNIFDDKIILKRNSSNREMILEFVENKKTISKYNVLNHTIDLNVFTKKINKKEKYLEIDYSIEDESINYKLVIK